MKRKNLTTAIVAGLAGIAGLSSISNASMYLNTDGVGQVLIYPYYTVNQEDVDGVTKSMNTLISVVNTTEAVKAVKVRFLEGKNSREVLDFNLYLSPFDVWTAALIPVLSTQPGSHVNEQTGKLITNDKSCTAPIIPAGGVEFRSYAYETPADPVNKDLIRSREGHLELIEMGTVTDATRGSASAATHVAGTPPGCQQLHNAWRPGGYWNVNPTVDMANASGGLFGSASLVNVDKGNAVSYNAEAIESWYGATPFNHTEPGDTLPDLDSGDDSSLVFDGGAVVETYWPRSVEAVSALFMRDELYAEYTALAAIHTETSYVVTFPTKAYYVDSFRSGSATPVDPFTRMISSTGACEPFDLSIWDREEQFVTGDIDFSPRPPEGDRPVLCWESNVINVNHDTQLSDVLYSNNVYTLTSPFSEGWMRYSFTQLTSRGTSLPFGGGFVHTYEGLPMTGFSVVQFVNGALGGTAKAEGALLANYATLFKHSYSKTITSN